MLPVRRPLATAAAVAVIALALTGCGAAEEQTPEHPDRIQVLASFYPLQFVAEEIGGDLVEVTNLTPPAAEPHDLELSPAQVRRIGDADLVVYLSGFQAAVDEAIDARDAQALDAAEFARLEASPNGVDAHIDEANDHSDESDEEHAEHADDDGHDHGVLDPHFWLDPTRLADVAEAVGSELESIDPDNADEYSANLDALLAELLTLDASFESSLAECSGAALVTSHEAFGYMAERYDLDQVGIAGIDPQTEPAPARLRELRDVVEEEGVTTIFTEANASAKVAETFADDVGVGASLLDPLETLTDESSDYVGIMETNLAALEDGLVCS